MMPFKIKVCQATLKRDVRSLSDMSPFAELEVGTFKKSTSIHQGGGKRPKWNQYFQFQASLNDTLIITVYDQGTFSNDPVGRGWMELSEFNQDGKNTEKIIQLFFNAKTVGKIQMQVSNLNELNISEKKQSDKFSESELISAAEEINEESPSSQINQLKNDHQSNIMSEQNKNIMATNILQVLSASLQNQHQNSPGLMTNNVQQYQPNNYINHPQQYQPQNYYPPQNYQPQPYQRGPYNQQQNHPYLNPNSFPSQPNYSHPVQYTNQTAPMNPFQGQYPQINPTRQHNGY